MKDSLQLKLADILKKDFERALPSKGPVTDVMWPEGSEELVVVANGKAYIMFLSGDMDDEFLFEDSDNELHTVPFSDEWIDANEEPNK